MGTNFEKNMDICILDKNAQRPPMDNNTAMIIGEFLLKRRSGVPSIRLSTLGYGVREIQVFSCSQKLITDGFVEDLQKWEKDVPANENTTTPLVADVIKAYPELQNCTPVSLSRTDDVEVTMVWRPGKVYLFSLAFYITETANEGAYSVVYHNCENNEFRKSVKTTINVSRSDDCFPIALWHFFIFRRRFVSEVFLNWTFFFIWDNFSQNFNFFFLLESFKNIRKFAPVFLS